MEEIIFSSSVSAESQAISRQLKAGKLRKIAPRIYTTNLLDSPESIVRRNLYLILSHLFPGALLSHRTAFEGKLTGDGVVFLTYKYTKKIRLPGVTVRVLQGPGVEEGDMPFLVGLHMSSVARAFLEVLQPSKNKGSASKSVSSMVIEERLDAICRLQGEEQLNRLRDQARAVSIRLGMQLEFEKLNTLIGAILGTRSQGELTSSVARARSQGRPFDPDRMSRLEDLFAELRTQVSMRRIWGDSRSSSWQNVSFFEAYFSNFIEGTRFDVEEAREIVFENKIPAQRPADAHDILGTYRIVADIQEMTKMPGSFDEFLTILRARHAVLLSGHPELNPGEFKIKPNYAGNTEFVHPDLVIGTLEKGFEIYRALEPGFAKAAFMMFLVAEVHPFTDGNGRIARVMMNAELVREKLVKIMIPTVYRDDYLLALRALTRGGRTDAFVRMLDIAQEFTASIDFSDYSHAHAHLEQANAFKESNEARLVRR